MPLTALVNMRWKRTALEKHNAAVAARHDIMIKEIRDEYEDSRGQHRKRNEHETAVRRKTKSSVKWKRPLSAANAHKSAVEKKKRQKTRKHDTRTPRGSCSQTLSV